MNCKKKTLYEFVGSKALFWIYLEQEGSNPKYSERVRKASFFSSSWIFVVVDLIISDRIYKHGVGYMPGVSKFSSPGQVYMYLNSKGIKLQFYEKLRKVIEAHERMVIIFIKEGLTFPAIIYTCPLFTGFRIFQRWRRFWETETCRFEFFTHHPVYSDPRKVFSTFILSSLKLAKKIFWKLQTYLLLLSPYIVNKFAFY